MEVVVAKAGSKGRMAEEEAEEEEEEELRTRGRAKSLRCSRRCESKLSISPLLS
jgi:hypothetical protein